MEGRHVLIIVLAVVILVIAPAVFLFHDELGTQSSREVVIYTSVDQVYSEPVLREFENRTGIHVRPMYDVEAAKTTGLVNRLIAEKAHPQADVFWSGEIVQTMLLEQEGVLGRYDSPSAADIPPQYKSPNGSWTGFGGRGRVLLVNTQRLGTTPAPGSIYDFFDERYPADSLGIAYPMFGTASTHAAALYAVLGRDEAQAFFNRLSDRGVRVVDGNSVVRDLVANGQLTFGLTDTDDACGAVERGAPVIIVIPDQETNGLGTLIIPNTVAVISGAPHEQEARQFVDYLLNRDTEAELAQSGWIQIPVRDGGIVNPCMNSTGIRRMNTSYSEIFPYLAQSQQDLRGIFIR
jgi:iron(III) transport system substrate-binding protein